MNTAKLQPYLAFDGNCEEAMKFYQAILGGDLTISRFGDFPAMPTPDGYKQKVMHAYLDNGPLTIMASDCPPNANVTFGDSVSLSISGDDDAALSAYFEKLSEGGTITTPLDKQVWGDRFGMLTDKYGMHWMVNIHVRPQENA